jgi:glycosyltransferase involved in cell wall biosynthesis
MRIIVVMTYYERQKQLTNTLLSLNRSVCDNFEVIIVDDGSKEDIVLPDLKYETTLLKLHNKKWTNPEPVYNTGLYCAMLREPDIIILQNAECYHVGDILEHAKRVTDKTYISFGCYSAGENFDLNNYQLNNIGASFNGQESWYNHPGLRSSGYDFCSAITAKNMMLLNGYDERFSEGIGYGDDYLLARIKAMGLKVEITENPYVIHQWHYNISESENKSSLVEKNRILFDTLKTNPEIKAKHIFTLDLCGYC